jgi:ribosomal protein S18 acetylase RimI-like enzyme
MKLPSFQRAWQVLRDEGVRSFWFKLLHLLGYHRLLLLDRPLTEPVPPAQATSPLAMDWLSPADVAEYLAFRSSRDARLLDERFERRHRCLLARADGRLVGVMWAATERAVIQSLRHELPLAPGEVYLYDAYTDPAFRGRCIAPVLSVELLRRFRDEGCRRAIRGTVPENEAALRAHAKAGFERYAIIRRVKLGPWRFVWQREF